MGLFSKKKAAIERRQNTKIHEIVCRSCFRGFGHNHVAFRAYEALDANGYRPAADDILEDYRYAVGLPPAGDLPVVLYPDDFSEIKKGYSKGVLASLADDFNNITSERLCPFCHSTLHRGAGFLPSRIICVLGAPNSGKFSFFGGLVRTIASRTAGNFPLSHAPASYAAFSEKPVRGPGIVVYTVMVADLPEIALVYFDPEIIGRDPACADFYTAHIQNAAGIFFAIDPVVFETIQDFFEPRARAVEYVPSALVGGSMLNAVQEKVPVAAVVTKSDLLAPLAQQTTFVRPGSNFFVQHSHRKHFGLSEFFDINAETEDFLADVDPNFLNAMKARFSEIGFFATSNAPGAAPVRTDEPFLWLLYRLGFIEGRARG